MTTGDEACAAGTTTVLELAEAPPELDLAPLVRSGVRVVRLTNPCDLSSQEPRTTLALLRLLREAAGDHVPVEWRGRVLGVDSVQLVHLTPPAPAPDEDPDIGLMAWRARHQPGLCYYRLGPDFVFVKDVRAPGAAARFRLVGEEIVQAFRTLEAVVDVASLDATASQLLDDLEAESLALRLGGLATVLPSRMRRWPVPSHEV